MNPRISVLSGPLRGQVFTIEDEPVLIGRDSSNRISIQGRTVSRRHCVIRRDPEGLRIEDLESHNGTFVNGIPVRERALAHGDQVRVSDSLFLILLGDTEELPGGSSVQMQAEELATHSELRLPWQDAIYPAPAGKDLPEMATLKRHFDALIQISTAMHSIPHLEPLQQRLLELIFEVIPADRGAILLGDSSESVSSMFGLEQRPGTQPCVQISRPIIDRVFREGTAILSNDIAGGKSAGVDSILCVPLPLPDQIIGVLYLDSSDRSARLGEDHLKLLTAIGRIAAFALSGARRFEWLEAENRRLQDDFTTDHDMVGESARIREVYRFVSKAAPTDSTVLITGESGTGKELVARALHRGSPRSERPFVAINCAALTETLLESELFGHEKGAFTGAVATKKGKMEVADGGTLFLDEIGELAQGLQAKLLRLLQAREFERVGGVRPIKVDLRVIAATNRNLEEAIRSGGFRQDLYYRLNVVRVAMPPLRERREDIPLLASYFVAKYGKNCGRRVAGLSADARALLLDYSWPGNIRELENAIERAVVLGSSELVLPEDLPETLMEAELAGGVARACYHDAIHRLKQEMITRAVEEAKGNLTEAARALGIHANYLHRLIRNMNLRPLLKGKAP
jgi:transcriptional regulator with GAF, ATPase, and Fis domain